LKRYKHANMACAVAKHKTDSRFAERDALPDYISTHDEVVKHTRVTARTARALTCCQLSLFLRLRCTARALT
jgi:hypothetical protein